MCRHSSQQILQDLLMQLRMRLPWMLLILLTTLLLPRLSVKERGDR